MSDRSNLIVTPSRSTDTKDRQIQAIADYIAYGIDHGCGECVGLELEHFMVTKDGRHPVFYYGDPDLGHPGVQQVLERLRPFYKDTILETQPDGSENLIGLSRDYAAVTIEPGAQFEISIGPVWEVGDLGIAYRAFRSELDPILDEFGFELVALGYHPTVCAQDVQLIPKNRYRFMDEHFTNTGKHGIGMMRATASTQVSIDYDSEQDAVNKFRIANALTPLLAFVTDNSPIYEGQTVGSRLADITPMSERLSRTGMQIPYRMARTAVWNDVDPQRSMTAPGTFDPGFGFASYARTVLEGPAIFSIEHNAKGEKRSVLQKGRSFEQVFEGKELDLWDIEHILSLYFYDVRFKTYIEIRGADSMPIEYALSFAAFIKGLFYDPGTVAMLARRFKDITPEDIASAKRALTLRGYDALVYGRSAADWLDELFALAGDSLTAPDAPYLDALASKVAARKTLVDTYDPAL